MIDGLIAANAPAEVIEAARRNFGGDEIDDCEVWEENWESVMLYLSLETQWVISPIGRPVGINYPSIESAMNMASIKKKRRALLFDDVRLMESVALSIFSEKK